MNPSTRNYTLLLAISALCALPALVGGADAQGTEGSAEGLDMAAAEAAMKQAATPGENHRFLAGLEGEWTFASTLWMAPDQPPVKGQGKSKKTMIMDGRYLQEETEGNMMGRSFHGSGITAFDNTAGEFINTWIDNMGTTIAIVRGRRDGNGLEMHGEYLDPMIKKMLKVRYVTRIVDQDHYVFEYYMTVPGAPEFKSMEIEYTRKVSE